MKSYSRLALCIPLAFVAVLFLAGSNLKLIVPEAPARPTRSSGCRRLRRPPPDQGPDPAAVNQAPDTTDQGPAGQSYTTEAPPPPGGENPDVAGYTEQPTADSD